ncbi:MAG: hypothetical protein IJG38_08130 [Thermoguttaceae bacterium]|nr:hypothetical protein [Thermoguttaceae bacterium]
MRNSDKWVRWNDRDDLQERFAILSESSNRGDGEFFFIVNKFPDELLGEVTERLDSEFNLYRSEFVRITLELLTFNELSNDLKIRAVKERRERNNSGCYWAVEINRVISEIEYYYEAQFETAAAGVNHTTGQNENFPTTWIYAKDDGAAVDNSSAAGMASLGLQSSTLTAIQDGFGMVIERQDKLIELQQQTAQNVTAQPSTAEQTDPAASMEKELDSIAGIGAIGRRRMLMMDKYGLTISQIWEYENPGSEWRFLDAGLKNAYRHKIEQAINRARDKVKPKKTTCKRQSKK